MAAGLLTVALLLGLGHEGKRHRPIIPRNTALAVACNGCTVRTEAKLILLSDLARVEPGADFTSSNSDAGGYFWAVAIAGQEQGYGGGSHWPWEIRLIKDEPGTPQLWGGIGGPGEFVQTPIVTWPPFWADLPDYASDS